MRRSGYKNILVATSFPYVLIDWIANNNGGKGFPVKHKHGANGLLESVCGEG